MINIDFLSNILYKNGVLKYKRGGLNMKKLEEYVRNIENFPKEGIIFRDITTIIGDKDGFKLAVDGIIEKIKDDDFNIVVGPESRGFIFGAPVAYALNKAFVLIRKKGKLPCETISEDYELEYGTATLEMHKNSIKPGDKVVIIDDLIATGGTTKAMIKLIERLGGEVVKVCNVIELVDLKGRENLKGYEIESLIQFEGE